MENFQDSGSNTGKDLESNNNRFENKSGRMLAGLLVVVVGVLLLARQAGADLPWWLFSWKTMLIAIGLFIGVRHSFRGIGWMFPIAVGGIFLIEDFMPDVAFHQYIWPTLIIIIGLVMILRPRKLRRKRDRWESFHTTDDMVDSVSIFGGSKKNIISKDFKGGDITTFFGGTELDLMQADIQGTVSLDVTQIFGGTKLVVPSNWNIKSEVVCVFGSIEDKRPQAKEPADKDKVLRLDGTCLFGGIEIKSL